MSGPLMKWAMDLHREELSDPQARAVLVALAWKSEGVPLFASVAFLADHTSFDARTVRSALAWLEHEKFIRATGKLHRNMKFYEVGPLSNLPVAKESGLLTEMSGVGGEQPLTKMSVVEGDDPSQFCNQPLTFLQPTPDKNVSRERLKKIEKGVSPAVIQKGSADEAPLAQPKERGTAASRAAVAESLKLLHSKVIR
jgi:hypothetical protein